MKKSVAASEKPVKAKEFDKELFKRSVEYNVRTLYRKNLEEADAFLEDSMAVVKKDMKEVKKYFKDNMDITGMSDEEILEASEVFPLPDGRFLIVEG